MEALDHPVIAHHQVQKGLTVASIGEPHVNRRLDRFTQGPVVDLRLEAHDDLSIDESLEPSSSRIGAKPHFPPQLSVRYATLLDNYGEYFSVNIIYHSVFHCTNDTRGRKPVPNAAKSGSLCHVYPSNAKGRDMTSTHDIEFQKLLSAWNRHEDLRQSGGPISQLADSRAQLDRVRRQLALAA